MLVKQSIAKIFNIEYTYEGKVKKSSIPHSIYTAIEKAVINITMQEVRDQIEEIRKEANEKVKKLGNNLDTKVTMMIIEQDKKITEKIEKLDIDEHITKVFKDIILNGIDKKDIKK